MPHTCIFIHRVSTTTVTFHSKMAQPCHFCQSIVSFDEDYSPDFVVQEDYFHQPCASCDIPEDKTTDLCAWCRHFRIRHLVQCIKLHDIWPRPHFYMRSDLLTKDPPGNCSLCQVFRHILLSMAHRIPLDDLSACCMEFALGDTDDSIRGWFTSKKWDDMIGPMFYVSATSTGECRDTFLNLPDRS